MMDDNPYVDWDKASGQLGGTKLLQNFVERFEKETLKFSLKNIQASLKVRDWNVVKREAHSLKGASGYVAADICQKLAEALQFAAQEEPVDEVKVNQCYNSLAEHSVKLQEYLSKHLNRDFSDPEGVFNYRAGQLANVKEEQSQAESMFTPEQRGTGSDGTTTYIIRRVTPPFTKVYYTEDDFEMQEDDLPDAYDEINKQWRCLII
jgi:HPt (histidine-containing phosphotransfer) domain-containing protein